MKGQKKFRELVLRQLHQYELSKRLIEEYEQVSLGGRSLGLGVSDSNIADPTAKQAVRLLEPDKRIRKVYSWVWAIERAWELFDACEPAKAKLMEHLFGLNGCEVCYDTQTRRDTLMSILHVSEPTLYRWREEIICAVMLGAIQAGIISPYDDVDKKAAT